VGAKTAIEWTDATWNAVRGCTRVSRGCGGPGREGGCYAETIAARFSGPGQPYEGLARRVGGEARWTGKVALVETHLADPLRWRRPRRIFVNSMSDLFHEAVPDSWIDRIFAVMALAPQHTFQVLTKRPERMRAYLAQPFGDYCDEFIERISDAAVALAGDPCAAHVEDATWPLPNVWFGVSVEDQAAANARIPALLGTAAAVRFLSCEPLLGPVDLMSVIAADGPLGRFVPFNALSATNWVTGQPTPSLDWVIAGGESGPRARPMHPAWARGLRDQCSAAGVPFFFKQWGEWRPSMSPKGDGPSHWVLPDGEYRAIENAESWPTGALPMRRSGKAAAGRDLDGRTWDQLPGIAA